MLKSYTLDLLKYCVAEDTSEFDKAVSFRNQKLLMMIVEWWRQFTRINRKRRKLDALVANFGPIIQKARGLEKLKLNLKLQKYTKKLERRAIRFWSFY